VAHGTLVETEVIEPKATEEKAARTGSFPRSRTGYGVGVEEEMNHCNPPNSYRDLWQQCECRAGELRSRALAAEARLEQAVGHVSELLDAAQWMTGSNDFSPEGQAHRGWLKFRPALERARAFLAQEPIAALAAGKEEE
jgi:hypothetical protein